MPIAVTPFDVRPAAELFKALSDENRLRMVALLAQGEACVCHIAAALEISQPNASQHLSVLKNAGVVDRDRRGSWIYYRLVTESDPARSRILEAVLTSCLDLAAAAADRDRLSVARADTACD